MRHLFARRLDCETNPQSFKEPVMSGSSVCVALQTGISMTYLTGSYPDHHPGPTSIMNLESFIDIRLAPV